MRKRPRPFGQIPIETHILHISHLSADIAHSALSASGMLPTRGRNVTNPRSGPVWDTFINSSVTAKVLPQHVNKRVMVLHTVIRRARTLNTKNVDGMEGTHVLIKHSSVCFTHRILLLNLSL